MYLLAVCKLKWGWGGLSGSHVEQIDFVQWLAHLAPSFPLIPWHFPFSIPASIVKANNLVHFEKLLSDSLFCEFSVLYSQPNAFDTRCGANL